MCSTFRARHVPRLIIFALCVAAFAATEPANAQKPAKATVLAGRVTDEKTNEPLSDVVVSLSSGVETRTATSGRYVLVSPRGGRLVVRFRRIGYDPGAAPLDVPEGDTTKFDITLSRQPEAPVVAQIRRDSSADTAKTTLDTVTVKAAAPAVSPRVQEFEDRRKHWVNGVFITQEDIRKRAPQQVTDMFRGIPAVTVIDSMGVKLVASQRAKKLSLKTAASDGLAWCVYRVGIDGIVRDAGYDVNAIAPEEVHGIEIFNGPAAIPSQYSGARNNNYCGLVMIWTRAQ